MGIHVETGKKLWIAAGRWGGQMSAYTGDKDLAKMQINSAKQQA
jgi:hypothetical protein